MTQPNVPIPVNRQALPKVSHNSIMYGNDATGETIVRTYDGRTHTVMRLRYPHENYPTEWGRECSDVLLRTTVNGHVREWFDRMNEGQKRGKFRKLKRYQATGAPIVMEMGDDKLPNPQPYTQTSWGDGKGGGNEPHVDSENPFSGSI